MIRPCFVTNEIAKWESRKEKKHTHTHMKHVTQNQNVLAYRRTIPMWLNECKVYWPMK